MADIASRSCGATIGLVYDLHHIARSMLHHIGEEHRIADYDQEASTSHGPSIRPPVSSTLVRMQPIRGRGIWRGRVDRRGHGRDGGGGHGRNGEGVRGTLEPTLPTSIPPHTYCSTPFLAQIDWWIRTESGLLAEFIYQNIYKKNKKLTV